MQYMLISTMGRDGHLDWMLCRATWQFRLLSALDALGDGVVKYPTHCMYRCLTPGLLTRTYLLETCSFLDVICNGGQDGLPNDPSCDFTNSNWPTPGH